MKKSIIRKLVPMMLAAGMTMGLVGCSASGSLENADKYTPGNASISDKIEAIDIDWAADSVTVTAGSGDTVNIIEKTNLENVEDKDRVHWWLDGTTLRIIYKAPEALLPMMLRR